AWTLWASVPSNFHDDRNHDWTSLGAVLEEAPELDAHALAQQRRVVALRGRPGVDRFDEQAGCVVHEVGALLRIDDPARHDLGNAGQAAGLAIEHDDRHHDPV